METRDLRDLVHFSSDAPRSGTLFETERLWSQVVCLERNQQIGPLRDPGSDAVFVVVAGKVVFQVDRGRKRLGQWEAGLAPADGEVTVTNASEDPAVVLIVAAPPPEPRGDGAATKAGNSDI